MHVWKHFVTITHHRHLVMGYCFRMGLVWQGLTHDLSKYSPTEFINGAKYYQGNRSPNVAERADKGYSEAWMHHKAHNRHHYEYWTDMNKNRVYSAVEMPLKYVAEMVADRIAACKTYLGNEYYLGSELDYLNRAAETPLMHANTIALLRELLTMLRDEGEKKTFAHLRRLLKEEKRNRH